MSHQQDHKNFELSFFVSFEAIFVLQEDRVNEFGFGPVVGALAEFENKIWAMRGFPRTFFT